MDKIIKHFLTGERLKAFPVKTLGVIVVGLIFIMGLSACGANKPISGHLKSKGLADNLYPGKKPSPSYTEGNAEVKPIPHVRTYPKGNKGGRKGSYGYKDILRLLR